MRILVIEDETRMLELLRKGLYEHGYTVMTAADGMTGLEIAIAFEFDAIVLDIGLPRLNGYGVMEALRARKLRTPVLMLTARDAEDEIIHGLDLGADDYLTKPFSFAELVARLQSITRSRNDNAYSIPETGEMILDPVRHTASRQGHSINLTRHEFLLLGCLMRNVGRCVARRQLMESVWGADHAIGATALDVLVNSLRIKIDGPFKSKLISTVRGSGYILEAASAAARIAK
jgi:DNA-binding response OmpR family regulator